MDQQGKFQFDLRTLLPIVALCAMAISHPLYNLFMQGDNATFFVAHQSKALDIYLMVFVFSAVLPLTIFLALGICGILSRNFAHALYVLVLFLLFSTLFMPASQVLLGNLGWGNVGLGVGAAIACTYAVIAFSWVRLWLSFAAVTALVSPVMFLASPAMRSFLATPAAQDYKVDLSARIYPNIVMVVFDEFPLISLLDENRQIDDTRYPNFARLADTSTWYRNCVTAHTTTTQAIPSILTGRYVNDGKTLASAENYPESLVSFLRPTHQLRGVEIVTKFFDPSEDQAITPVFGFGLRKMGMDLLIVMGHLLTPQVLAERLPAINSNWQDFSPPPEQKGKHPPKPRLLRQFIDVLRTTPHSSPAFFYLHMLLPHSPLRFNDDGRSLGNELHGYGLGTRSPTPHTFAKNKQDSLLIYQAHLLQTRYTDYVLGEILDELENLGLFSDSLIVVTSDHGIGYAWYEGDRSNFLPERAEEVYWVPLFLKKPGQDNGEINDERVVSVDIFPTIAEILGKPIPWAVDGISAIGPQGKRENRSGTGNPDQHATWLPAGKEDFAALERKIALFGQHNLTDLYFFGPDKDLIGQNVEALPLDTNILNAGVARLESRPPVSSANAKIPFYLKGELMTVDPNLQAENLDLAISVNGKIMGTTNPSTRDDRMTFTTRIPQESWVPGQNSVSVYAILEDKYGKERSLVPFTIEMPE